jgi:hypothetical protein
MFGGHTGQNSAGVALDDAKAVGPSAFQFDQVAPINEPKILAILRSIKQVLGRRVWLNLILFALPRAWGIVKLTDNGHRSAHSAFTGRLLISLLLLILLF